MATVWVKSVVLVFIYLLDLGTSVPLQEGSSTQNEQAVVKRMRREVLNEEMRNQVELILEHFKQDDPKGFPGIPIPDPLLVPDFEGTFPAVTIHFQDIKVYGLRKFNIVHVTADLATMKLSLALSIDYLYILGTYSLSYFWSTASGPFNMTLEGILMDVEVRLEVGEGGVLQTQNINMNVKYEDNTLKFENLGFVGGIIQGILNSIGPFIFDTVKAPILEQVSSQVRTLIDDGIKDFGHQFPDSISTLDIMIAKVKSEIHNLNLDPLVLPEFHESPGNSFPISIHLIHGELKGLSTIHRTGNITVSLKENVVIVIFEVGFQKLMGQYDWSLQLGFSRNGKVQFIMDSLDIHINLTQSANVEKSPRLENFDLSMGNFQMRSSGAGTLDYIIEFLLNVFPNALKGLIMDAVEIQVKKVIQKHLDDLDIEEIINQQLDKKK